MLFRSLSESIHLSSSKAPFGAVRGGFIRLRGRIRQLDPSPETLGKPKKKWYEMRRPKTPPPPFTTSRITAAPILRADTEEDVKMVDEALAGKGNVFMLELIPYKPAPSGSGLSPETPTGYLLVKAGSTGEDTYRRVGIFYYSFDVTLSNFGYCESEPRRSTRMNLFYNAEWQDINIV